ncbi:hypothetical protein BD324DRAFT_581472 [Kockovaella imperatae]|uniref:RBR-type E3 ubiquitin transferase n=1 Tax=Kockovaella imperatae TaxID=4999 RepID=A0A1Y1UD81_9TREE|nr:hypothetical protein BD324DRAFT_581472 [Kockovaella imperatae]ORX36001.1 hypothetical protein BD324DRAFT_581472 [Kockovaella imperatae]
MASPDIEAECLTLQGDEILALESIYPSLIESLPNNEIRLSIPITLPSPTAIILQTIATEPSSSNVLPTLDLEHLPPLTVSIALPTDYPLKSPPRVVDIRAPIPGADKRSNWLSRKVLYKIGLRLEEMWRSEQMSGEGAGVIWQWWEWVGNGQFFEDLGLSQDGISFSLWVPPSLVPSTFHTLLNTFNAKEKHSEFESVAFSCAICMESRKGKSCAQMTCGCVFCVPCLSLCWSLAIEEGTLENVACPSVDCVKQRATGKRGEVDGSLVESVVGHELRARWDELKERRRAEIDPNWTTCPRISCQAAVPPPPEEDDQVVIAPSSRVIRLADIDKTESTATATAPVPAPVDDRWARHRQCPKCHYSFCLYCSATWHGPHTPCAFPQTSALVLEYLSYPEGSFSRLAMEKRRGKANLERMVAQWREDQENRKWLESKTRACSGCGVRVEKSHGCNHMTCGRCQAHFCYRCGASISPQDPYAHYNRPGQACFEKLFDQEEIDFYERQATVGVEGEVEWRPAVDIWGW